jgi:hypothetical protein
VNYKKMHQTQTIAKRFKVVRSVAWLFLLASLLLLVYTYYRAEIVYHGKNDAHYFNYYLISLAGVIFWGVVLRLKDEIKLNIEILFVSMVVGVYLVEMVLNIISPGKTAALASSSHRVEAAKEAGVIFDTRSKNKVYHDLLNEGTDAVPSIRASSLVKMGGLHKEGADSLLSFGGVSNITTVGDNESGEFLLYQSDRYGFNNPDSEWDSSPTQWLLTGDSFVAGITVPTGEDISGQIRKITHQSVINLGISGNGPLLELAVLKEYAESVKPNTVLWVYFEGNDLWTDLKREKPFPLLLQYLQPGFTKNLIHRQAEIDDRLGKYIVKEDASAERLWGTRVWRLYNIRNRLKFAVKTGVDIDIEPLFTEILVNARDLTAAWGGKFVFVYLPQHTRYATGVKDHDLYRKRSEVIEVVKSLNIPVIDIHEKVFANHPDPLSLFPFRLTGHYTAEGYNEVAKAIVSGVKNGQQKLVSVEH